VIYFCFIHSVTSSLEGKRQNLLLSHQAGRDRQNQVARLIHGLAIRFASIWFVIAGNKQQLGQEQTQEPSPTSSFFWELTPISPSTHWDLIWTTRQIL
jgi:hypothetical protein